MVTRHRADLPSDVSPTNVHASKLVHRRGDLEVPGGWLKWYEIGPAALDLDATSASARTWLETQVMAGLAPLADQVGFVEVHHCPEVVFLIASTWRHENELWQSTWVWEGSGEPTWEPVTRVDRGHRPVFCVWELMPVGFERDAWVRFLRSRRTTSDLEAYRRATFEGMG